MVQTQFTPVVIRNLLCQTPLSCQPILGNGSTLQISCDCWSKGQSDGRYPLIANFNFQPADSGSRFCSSQAVFAESDKS